MFVFVFLLQQQNLVCFLSVIFELFLLWFTRRWWLFFASLMGNRRCDLWQDFWENLWQDFWECPTVFHETSMIAFLDGQQMMPLGACDLWQAFWQAFWQKFWLEFLAGFLAGCLAGCLAGLLAGFLRMSYCVSRDVDDCLSLGWLPWWATDDATGSDLQISQATICRLEPLACKRARMRWDPRQVVTKTQD